MYMQAQGSVELKKRMRAKIAGIEKVADQIPGVLIIYDIRTLSVVYMSKKGQELLGCTLEELIEMGPEYHNRFFNPQDAEDYVPKILDLIKRNNNDESITFFQQVKIKGQQGYTWHMSNVKIFMKDDNDQPIQTIIVSFPIDPMHHISTKVSRLLEENNFLRKNFQLFAQLGKRECEVLKHLALGKTSAEIGEQLFISAATVETHRKNIKQKLAVNSLYELTEYARAFDLI